MVGGVISVSCKREQQGECRQREGRHSWWLVRPPTSLPKWKSFNTEQRKIHKYLQLCPWIPLRRKEYKGQTWAHKAKHKERARGGGREAKQGDGWELRKKAMNQIACNDSPRMSCLCEWEDSSVMPDSPRNVGSMASLACFVSWTKALFRNEKKRLMWVYCDVPSGIERWSCNSLTS